MRNKIILLGLVFVAALSLKSCKPAETTSGYYNYKTECLGVEAGGTRVVRAWGKGLDKKEAQQNAYKNAISEILFEGIQNGRQECGMRPVIIELDARNKYDDYFNAFFSRRGEYMDFVDKYERRPGEGKQKSNYDEAFAFVFKVDVPSLKAQLKRDKILN